MIKGSDALNRLYACNVLPASIAGIAVSCCTKLCAWSLHLPCSYACSVYTHQGYSTAGAEAAVPNTGFSPRYFHIICHGTNQQHQGCQKHTRQRMETREISTDRVSLSCVFMADAARPVGSAWS